jgi:2-polyprenyl-6-methoxyphenol hydroxylase-like FAD-dependent oxidoreductase
MEHMLRAVIVGAGIAGLSAAKGLRLIGWDVDVYEQAPELEPIGAGISLSANALNALRSLGLYDAVAAKAQPVHRIDLLAQRGDVLHSTNFTGPDGKAGDLDMVVLHRGDLQQTLLSGLPDLCIRTGMECIGAQQAEDRIQLAFANGESVEADLALGCDGIHSAVRRAIFPESRERFAHYTCWRAITPGIPAQVDSARLTETWGAGKRFGLAALPEDRVYWFACCGADRMNDSALAKMDLRSLQGLFAGFHDPIPEVLSRTPPGALIWTDIVDLAPMPSFVRGRIVLLGDAAHAVTPDLGQGAGLAIEDAAVISALLGRHSLDAAFRAYDARRVARARRIAAASRFYAAIAQWQHPVMVRVRNRAVTAIPESVLERQLSSILDYRLEPVAAAA